MLNKRQAQVTKDSPQLMQTLAQLLITTIIIVYDERMMEEEHDEILM